MTTSTERLRALLNERGVEYETEDGRFARVTKWTALNGRLATFAEYNTGETEFALSNLSLTPEQAIAATLGEADEGCYLMRDGTKFPVELDYGFLAIMPITIKVGGFRYLLEVPDGE